MLFPIYVSKQKFEDLMDLLLVRDGDKSHYVYIKDFSRFMFHKTKSKNKKWFCKSCLQRFSSKNVLTDHKENVLCINGAQSVKLEKGTIKFENYCREIRCPFKIYCDFEWNLEGVEIYEGAYSKRDHSHISCSFAYKVVWIDNRFSKRIVVFIGKNAAYEFIKAILKEYEHYKKVIKKHFNKDLIITEKQEHLFQHSSSCWICGNLIDDDDEKVRNHGHVTAKFRAAAHWDCNISLELTKKVLAIFYNLRGYDSHLIFIELNKFDVKIDVTPNGLEKYIAFYLNKNLVFIDRMQFLNFNLDKLVKTCQRVISNISLKNLSLKI